MQCARGSQICSCKREQFAAPTVVWCVVHRLAVVVVLSSEPRRNYTNPSAFKCAGWSQIKRRDAKGTKSHHQTVTKLGTLSPSTGSICKQVTAETNPTSLPQIIRWFLSKVMWPFITNPGPQLYISRKYYKVLRLAPHYCGTIYDHSFITCLWTYYHL